ncbi:MAG: hypothetical protein PVH02_07375 [Desulfobacteraceae bacterium]|jgi:hypothetical protein
MRISVSTSEELGKAIKDNEGEIEITGDIKAEVRKIITLPKAPWVVAVGAISASVFSVLTTGDIGISSSPVTIRGTAFSLAPIVGVSLLGEGPFLAGISIAIAGGGVDALSNLRNSYEFLERPGKAMLIMKTGFRMEKPAKDYSLWDTIAYIKSKCIGLFQDM